MPTGSLCAERNVIGNALADDVGLMRKHIKLIAVYSVNIQDPNSMGQVFEKKRFGGSDEVASSIEVVGLGSPSSRLEPPAMSPRSPSILQRRSIVNIRSNSYSSKHASEDNAYDSDHAPQCKKAKVETSASADFEVSIDATHAKQRNVPFSAPMISCLAPSAPVMTSITVDERYASSCRVCSPFLLTFLHAAHEGT